MHTCEVLLQKHTHTTARTRKQKHAETQYVYEHAQCDTGGHGPSCLFCACSAFVVGNSVATHTHAETTHRHTHTHILYGLANGAAALPASVMWFTLV